MLHTEYSTYSFKNLFAAENNEIANNTNNVSKKANLLFLEPRIGIVATINFSSNFFASCEAG